MRTPIDQAQREIEDDLEEIQRLSMESNIMGIVAIALATEPSAKLIATGAMRRAQEQSTVIGKAIKRLKAQVRRKHPSLEGAESMARDVRAELTDLRQQHAELVNGWFADVIKIMEKRVS